MIDVVAESGNEKSKYLKIVKKPPHVSTLKNRMSHHCFVVISAK